ncbi:hypothetical protein SESBI_14246 [Sesbania bispinosa]|nr:hypothetical protein SESBI_14246 [Sesbania bispinosa]
MEVSEIPIFLAKTKGSPLRLLAAPLRLLATTLRVLCERERKKPRAHRCAYWPRHVCGFFALLLATVASGVGDSFACAVFTVKGNFRGDLRFSNRTLQVSGFGAQKRSPTVLINQAWCIEAGNEEQTEGRGKEAQGGGEGQIGLLVFGGVWVYFKFKRKVNGVGSGSSTDIGVLPDGSQVVLKRFKNCSVAGDSSFTHEVEVIASVRHVNSGFSLNCSCALCL